MTRNAMACAVLAMLLTAITVTASDDQPPVQYAKPRQLAKLANKSIKESSGMAWSWSNENVIWTHNDSGDRPRIFAFNLVGTHVAEFRIEGEHIDWEDMASFKDRRNTVLVVGDIGDNALARRKYTLYVFKEPAIRDGQNIARPATIRPLAMDFTYDDGPQNAEALAVDARSGKIYIVSKTKVLSCKVYELTLPRRRETKQQVAKAVATLTLPAVTAMDISPDGRRAIVLTYGDAYEFTRGEKQTWPQAFKNKPRLLPMPQRRKGESICYGADGKTLYLTSEGLPTPLLEVPVLRDRP